MSIDTALSDLMNSTVVVSGLSSVSTDGYGVPVYGSGSTYSARVSHKQELVKNLEGIEEMARAVAWVAATSTFSPYGRITVDGSTLGPVLAVEALDDEAGVLHHVKVWFG